MTSFGLGPAVAKNHPGVQTVALTSWRDGLPAKLCWAQAETCATCWIVSAWQTKHWCPGALDTHTGHSGAGQHPRASNIWQLTWAQAHLEAQRYCVRANHPLKNTPKGQETLLRSDLGPLGLQCEARKSASVLALATQMWICKIWKHIVCCHNSSVKQMFLLGNYSC